MKKVAEKFIMHGYTKKSALRRRGTESNPCLCGCRILVFGRFVWGHNARMTTKKERLRRGKNGSHPYKPKTPKLLSLCACGCGAKTKNKFISGHNIRLLSRKEQSRRGRLNDGSTQRDVENNGRTYRKVAGHHEHKIIAEVALGRKLRRGEVVHHWNRNRRDNRNKNLLICKQGYHNLIHKRMRQFNYIPRN